MLTGSRQPVDEVSCVLEAKPSMDHVDFRSCPAFAARHNAPGQFGAGSTMAEIFISYVPEDEMRVRELADALEQHGFSIFLDCTVRAGESRSSFIDEAFDEAKCIIVVWSRHVHGSDQVKDARKAQVRGILVPVILEPVAPPEGFSTSRTADLTDWQPGRPSAGFRLLLEQVRRLVLTPPHRPVPSQPYPWWLDPQHPWGPAPYPGERPSKEYPRTTPSIGKPAGDAAAAGRPRSLQRRRVIGFPIVPFVIITTLVAVIVFALLPAEAPDDRNEPPVTRDPAATSPPSLPAADGTN